MKTSITNEEGHRILEQIKEDMDVFDSQGNHIGDVEDIYLGSATDEEREMGTGPASAGERYAPSEESFMQDLAAALGGEIRIPRELVSRLLYEGYIKLDSDGLFAADRYILPDQIAAVQSDGVHLNVEREKLVKQERG